MKKIYIILALLLCGAQTAFAVDFGGGANPAVINKQNIDQLKEMQVEEKFVRPVAEDGFVKKQEDVSKKKTVVKGNLTYNPQFTLTSIKFVGNTKISDKKLNNLSKDILGKQVYLEDVMNLVLKISRYYQQKGYLTSYAYLPAQDIENGCVTIMIKESKVASKSAEGYKWERQWYFNNVAMSAPGLQKDKVFNARDLQGAMKKMNQEDYLNASAQITKNKDGDTEVKLHVQDRLPLKIDLGWDDFGRNYTGRQRFTSIVGLDNFLGFGDKIYGGAILSQDSVGALAGYQIPVNKHGTRLSFDYSYSKMDVGGPYRDMGIYGNASTYSLKLIHPLKSTVSQEISAFIGVDATNSKASSSAASSILSDYKLRVLRTGINGMIDDKHGRTIFNVGVDLGANALGASDNIDNGPQSAFWKIVAGLARIQRLPKKCLGVIRINGQYTPQALYSAEQMYLGGVYSIRGYQPSEILGDYGVAGSFEIRTPVPGLDKILPEKIKNWSDKIKLAAFYDWGYVNSHNDNYGYPNHFLQSVGVGTYINLTNAIYVQLGIGFPIGQRCYNEDKARFYFSINTDLDKILLKPKERL